MSEKQGKKATVDLEVSLIQEENPIWRRFMSLARL
jgi:hypothetical protein